MRMFHLPENHHNFSMRLSEVFDDIGVNERMVLKRRRSTLLQESIFSVSVPRSRSLYQFGSQSEGTTTIGLNSDADILLSLDELNVIQDYAEWKHGCKNLLMIQDDITSPGYCHLQHIRPDEPLPVTDMLDENCFRDADDRILLKNTYFKSCTDLRGGVFSGPAYTVEEQPGIKASDFVIAIPCKSWPYGAKDWLNRHVGKWPTTQMKRCAQNGGCFVVPVGSKLSAGLVWDDAACITLCTEFLLKKIIDHSQRYETIFQHLMQTISNFVRRYQEGTKLEKTATSFLVPFLCSTLGSVQASNNISTNNSISPEAFNWLSAGLNSDVSSWRLKIATVVYCAGDLVRAELVLRETERLYCLDTVEPVCKCYDSAADRKRGFSSVCNDQNEKAISTVVAFCIRFFRAERNCIPHELQYEMFRSTEEDLRQRNEYIDCWVDWAVVDSLPFLYFLQYKTYGHLHRYNDQQRALSNLIRTIISEDNLGHRETALNILGQCMEQENRPHDALTCYTTSLNIRERNNVARFHICRLLALMLNTAQ